MACPSSDPAVEIPTEHQDRLKQLAHLMLLRHVQSSLSPDSRERLKDAYLPLRFKEEAKRDYRVLALVGAGASAEALAIARELAKELISSEPDLPGYEAELLRLEKVQGFAKDAFETQLAALSRTPEGERRVRQTIAAKHRITHPTLLAYELLAHLMKHRFLDAIITLNFDELLDQSLSDELSEQEYVKIISERDCHGMVTDPGDEHYTPVYMKLHGTASDAASLRFTRDAYYFVPEAMARVICNLVGYDTCVLLNLGSRMDSFDFNNLLQGPAALQVFNLSRGSLTDRVQQEIRTGRAGETKTTHFFDVASEAWTIPNGRFPSGEADVLCDELVKRIAAEAKQEARVVPFRPVDRHRLVAGLLNWLSEPGKRELYEKYLYDRAVIEVSLCAVRSHGLVSVASLERDRCVKYLDLYRRVASTGRSLSEEWKDVCSRGGLRPSQLSDETFVSLPEVRIHAVPERSRESDETDIRDLDVEPVSLARHLESGVSTWTLNALARFGRERVEHTLAALHPENEVEIHSKEDRICRMVFLKPLLIHTLTTFKARTICMLDRSDYNQLAVVAETGDWLLSDPFGQILSDKPGLELFLILAFDLKLQKLRDALEPRGITLYVQQSHWWRHNRHMAIICDQEKPKAGIYFARRQRSTFITPVYLQHEDDKAALLKEFRTYWKRALQMPPALGPRDVGQSFEDMKTTSGVGD